MAALDMFSNPDPDLSVAAVLARRLPPPGGVPVSAPGLEELDPVDRVARAKVAWTVRRLPLDDVADLVTDRVPQAGDAVLVRVLELGQHQRLETVAGRRQALHPGDEIVVVYGDRYAADQFEALVPPDTGLCELVAGGGIAARVAVMHDRMAPPTLLEPVGLLAGCDGHVLDVRRPARPSVRVTADVERPTTVAVAGTSMNAGKTTTAAALIRGATLAGWRVGAAKVTGTGSGGDYWAMVDAGARPVLDFSDRGFVTTYRIGLDQVRRVFRDLTDELHAAGCDLVVLEIADGLFQEETDFLLRDPLVGSRLDGLLFAAGDALGATGAVARLRQYGIEPTLLSGLLSASPLASREARAATGLQVWGVEELADPAMAGQLVRHFRDAGSDTRGADVRRLGSTGMSA